MDEQTYYKKVYSYNWMKQTKKYGLGKYEQFIVKQLQRLEPESVFEVGIGTGWPIATTLKERQYGIEINGCDIAENLVEEAKNTLGVQEGIYVGDIMECDIKKQYDIVYCVRSSWYIPDFYGRIERMLQLVKAGGYLVFDIMDDRSLYCFNQRKMEFGNWCFDMLGIERDKIPPLRFYSRKKVERILKKKGIKYKYYVERKITSSKDYANTPKVLYVCHVE